MPVAPSFQDLTAQYEAEARLARPTLQFLEGDLSVAHEHGSAAIGDAILRFAVQAFKETFIDGAKGDALTALCDDHLNIQRGAATAAQVVCVFVRDGGSFTGATIPVGFVIGSQFDASGSSVLFTLETAVVFTDSTDLGPHTAVATAQTTGRTTNVGADTITRVVDALPAGIGTVTVTNPATSGGGNDEEGDDELRVRARNFWQTLRRGTLQALEFGALRVDSVRIARASEDPTSGIVTLVVTDSDGNSTAQMVSDAAAEIENWRAAGSIVNTIGGTALIVNIFAALIAKDGVDTSVLGPVAAEAVIGRMNKLRHDEKLFIDTIKAAAISVDPDALEALIISNPIADVEPSPGQVIRPGVVIIT